MVAVPRGPMVYPPMGQQTQYYTVGQQADGYVAAGEHAAMYSYTGEQPQEDWQADEQAARTGWWMQDQTAEGPYHNIAEVGAVDEAYAALDQDGHATPSNATQGSSKEKAAKRHGHKGHKKSHHHHKDSHKKAKGHK
jgi:hypothetical protein